MTSSLRTKELRSLYRIQKASPQIHLVETDLGRSLSCVNVVTGTR